MDVASIQADHRVILGKVRALSERIEDGELEAQAERLAWMVRDLGQHLQRHFAAEREGLYGRLDREGGPVGRSLVKLVRDEAEVAEAQLDPFIRHWVVPLHIAREPERFRADARTLFRCVGRRTGREERELLPRLATVDAVPVN